MAQTQGGQPDLAVTHDPNDNYVTQLWVLCTLFPSLATITVALRFYARRLKRLELGWDDWTAALAVVWAWAFYGCAVFAIPSGAGRHIEFVSKEGQRLYLISLFAFQPFYVVLPPTVKISALFLYKRIFITRGINIVFNTFIIFLVVWALTAVFICIFSCTPVSAAWEGGGHCILLPAWVLGYGIPNIILDVAVWALPIPSVWALQLPTSQKLALSGIFAFGLVDCALAIVRLAVSYSKLGDPDFTYNDTPTIWWTLIHTSLGIIVISLPTMRILFTRFCQKLGLTRDSNSSAVASKTYRSYRGHSTIKAPRNRQWAELTVSGDDEEALHSNTIARAVHRHSEGGTIRPTDGIYVVSEFTLETERSDAIPLETGPWSPRNGASTVTVAEGKSRSHD